MAWNVGVTLCVAPDELMAKDPRRIVDAMGVTHLHLTPTLASRLDPQMVPSVRYLGTSGEPLMAKAHRDWAGKGLYHGIFGHPIDLAVIFVLINSSSGYTIRGLAGLCTVPVKIEASSAITSIGVPPKNTSVMVIANKAGFNLLPRGAVGLLCFGGDQVVSREKTVRGNIYAKSFLLLREHLLGMTSLSTQNLADSTELVIWVESFLMVALHSSVSMLLSMRQTKPCYHRSLYRIL